MLGQRDGAAHVVGLGIVHSLMLNGARYPINDLAFHPSKPVIAIATGTYVRTGALVFEMHLQVDGVSTVALSMCALGQSIAVGTIDGRLLLLRIESFRP